MEMLETRSVYDVELEVRQQGAVPTITGRFPYGSKATVSNAGRRRKEEFSPGSFEYVLRPDQQHREINFLMGHDLNRPLASRSTRTMVLSDSPEALTFTATLPPEGQQTTWQRDFLLAHDQGMIKGISPGYIMPPRAQFPDAETTVPEAGNPGVFVRVLRRVVLAEFSASTRPSYPDTSLEARDEAALEAAQRRPYWELNREVLRWL